MSGPWFGDYRNADDSAYWPAPRGGGNPKGMHPDHPRYRHYNPYSGYEPSELDERAAEEGWEDEDRESNWGPPPSEDDLTDPGFPEEEVDTHPDPDHMRDYRAGAILTQAEQWPERCAAYTGHGLTESEIQAKKKHDPVGADVKRLKGKDTGLYGEDESDTYDVIATPSPDKKGWDVLKSYG